MASVHIGQALQKLVKNARWESRINALRIVQDWEVIMGKVIAKYTESVILKEGVLIIHTNVAPLKQELQMNKEQIIQRVNEYLKAKVVQSVAIR